jgi:murein L,D-transpeptidase YafK
MDKMVVMKGQRYSAVLAGVVGIAFLLWLFEPVRTFGGYVLTKIAGPYSVGERLAQFDEVVKNRVHADFAAAGVLYPPKHLAVLAFKDSQLLELYAKNAQEQPWQLIKTYPIVKASGVLGPKLQEGDKQVPEGIYQSESLNPNSRYHLAIRVNYPNEFDRQMAVVDGRTNLGGDIMIHGSSSSVGCLAMGNEAAEDLFVLAAHTASLGVKIVISPTDFRKNALVDEAIAGNKLSWRAKLYTDIRQVLQTF